MPPSSATSRGRWSPTWVPRSWSRRRARSCCATMAAWSAKKAPEFSQGVGMSLKLFELVGADAQRPFSPYCWRTRMALAHKGLAAESIPWRFTEKAAIAVHGSEKVPVMLDGDRAVADSWTIANHLEDAYPDRPSLFGGAGGRRSEEHTSELQS